MGALILGQSKFSSLNMFYWNVPARTQFEAIAGTWGFYKVRERTNRDLTEHIWSVLVRARTLPIQENFSIAYLT
jgi:hypothetical protein